MANILYDIQSDLLAFLVLLSLIVGLIVSFIYFFNPEKFSAHPKRSSITPIIMTLLGLPVLIDLVRVGGLGTFFSILLLLVLFWNLYVIVSHLLKKKFGSFVENGGIAVFPALIFGGCLTAGYLTYVEITSSLTICGIDFPGCGTVQSSSYAKLLGFFPVALLGLLGYLAILATWLINRSKLEQVKSFTAYIQWGLCLFGVVFSMYLTYIEVFVLRATCSWCITSAVLMNLLLWYSTSPASAAWLKRQKELEEELEDGED